MPKPKIRVSELYCFCRQEDKGLFMIYCENCHIWYHGECVNMTKEASKRISRWFCVWCTTCLQSSQKTAEEHKQLQFNVSKIQGELNQLKASIKSRNQEKPHQELEDGTKNLEERNSCKERDIASLIQSKKLLSDKIMALEQENLQLKENLLKSADHEKDSQDLIARIRQLEQENEGLLGGIAVMKSKCEEMSSILEMKKAQSDDAIALMQENQQLKEKLIKSTTDQEERRNNQDLSAVIQELKEENVRLLGEVGPLQSNCVKLKEMLARVKNRGRLSLTKECVCLKLD